MDEPKTPTKGSFASREEWPLRFTKTPPTPGSENTSFSFSPNDSDVTDITDYGWDSPTPFKRGDQELFSRAPETPSRSRSEGVSQSEALEDRVADIKIELPPSELYELPGNDALDTPCRSRSEGEVKTEAPEDDVAGPKIELTPCELHQSPEEDHQTAPDTRAESVPTGLEVSEPMLGVASTSTSTSTAFSSEVEKSAERPKTHDDTGVIEDQAGNSAVKDEKVQSSAVKEEEDPRELSPTPPQDTERLSPSVSTIFGDEQTPRRRRPRSRRSSTIGLASKEESISKEDQEFKEFLAKCIPASLQERHRENNEKCVASPAGSKERCKNNRPLLSRDSTIFDRLAKMTAIVREDVEQTTNDLTESAFCTSHRKAMRNRVGARLGPSPWSDESSSFRILRQQLEVVLTGKEAVVMEDLEPGWNLKPPVYAPYFRIESEGKSITQRLLEVLIQPLTAKDVVHEAHIYIYWIDAAPVGHVKIGYARDVEARLKQWEGGCNRPLQRYFPNALEEIQPVPHALRVETLIHTELEAYRRVEPRCPECGKEHAEWFEVAGEVAARVVRKWMTWMRERPYVEEKGRDGRPSWVLDKEKGIRRLAELSTPIPLSCSAGNETEALGSRLTVPGGNCSRQRRYSNTV